MRNSELIHPKLSYKIVGFCFDVHNELGRFAREKQYSDLLEKIFKANKLKFNRELRIGDSGNHIDFLVDDKIILELKAKRIITRDDYFQVQRYLQHSKLKLGIIVNFRNKYLTPKRVLKSVDEN